MYETTIHIIIVRPRHDDHHGAGSDAKGRILDKAHSTPLEFVNILVVAQSDTTKIIGSAISDADGKFAVRNLKEGKYVAQLS